MIEGRCQASQCHLERFGMGTLAPRQNLATQDASPRCILEAIPRPINRLNPGIVLFRSLEIAGIDVPSERCWMVVGLLQVRDHPPSASWSHMCYPNADAANIEFAMRVIQVVGRRDVPLEVCRRGRLSWSRLNGERLHIGRRWLPAIHESAQFRQI